MNHGVHVLGITHMREPLLARKKYIYKWCTNLEFIGHFGFLFCSFYRSTVRTDEHWCPNATNRHSNAISNIQQLKILPNYFWSFL